MASSSRDSKRKNQLKIDDDDDHNSISPPPLRRKVQSTTTKNSISAFFKPTSQKPPEAISWQERAPDDDTPASLVVGKYVPADVSSPPPSTAHPPAPRRKIAAFDLDWTLIRTISGKRIVFDAADWKWWHPSVPGVLRKMYYEEGYIIVIISNQGGISLRPKPKAPTAHRGRLETWKNKVTAVLRQLDIPISVYAATEYDIYRKPRTGMWREILDDHDLTPNTVDLDGSFFVGDAAGRKAVPGIAKDFSGSDRGFGDNVGIKFLTPEEYFLNEKPREFARAFEPAAYVANLNGSTPANDAGSPPIVKSNDQDIIIFVGSPGAGKSTFFERYLKPLGYERINQDLLKTKDKCLKVAREKLAEGFSVVIDSTNPDEKVRSSWVTMARENSIPIRCVLFLADSEVCKHNDAVRALNNSMNPEKRTLLPNIAFTSFLAKYRKPSLDEGFEDITEVGFQFEGTDEERAIWTRYWM